MAYLETEAYTHVTDIVEPGLSDAGDRDVSNISSNSLVFLSELCAKLILVLLPSHREAHIVLSALYCLSRDISSISSGCPHLETFSQVTDTC